MEVETLNFLILFLFLLGVIIYYIISKKKETKRKKEIGKIKKTNEDIIFQVKIDREKQTFELVKVELKGFEQSSFEQYLNNYLEALNDIRVEIVTQDYIYEDEVDE